MRAILFVLVALFCPPNVSAITWCHDYVYYVISGKDSNRMSAAALRQELTSRGYTLFKSLPKGTVNESGFLKKGDVLIFDEAHSGIVVDDQGHIDHFLQKYGTTVRTTANPNDVTYTPEQAMTEYDPTLKTNLLRRGWTIDRIRSFTYRVALSGGTITSGQGSFVNSTIQIWRGKPAVDLVVEVRDAETNRGISEAEIRVHSTLTGAEVYAALTNNDGGTDKLEIPGEKAAQGLQVRVKANNYEEKWSDVARELLTGGDRRFTVFLKRKVDMRFVGTWRCPCNYSITLNQDGTGVFIDSRGGPQGSLYASGTFNGKWTSSGNTASLDLGPEHKHRSGTFVLTLKDGKLSDQFGGVFTK